jgi:16S rRNA (cytosine1402-N4)-methyltransferase
VPVLVAETLEALALAPGMVVVDGTVGAGGHALGIARAIGPDGTLIGLDRDVEILACAREAFAHAAKAPGAQARVSLHHLVFSRMREALSQAGFRNCDRVLLDLGVSSLQLDSSRRGFSFMADGPLDMRMDASAQTTAAAWLARVPEPELARVLFEYGGERHSRRIARAICTARQRTPLQRTQQLADLVVRSLPPPARRQRIHPATRTFQAIRMAVNDEPGELQNGLVAARDCLRPGGRLCVISFHSAEDGMVKRFVREQMQPLWRKPVTPGPDELAVNPRARSARLRCGVRAGEESR